MASEARVLANRANAQHSTGPRTPEGKAAVARNAVRHGLTSRDLVIREDEREEFEALQSSLYDEVQPYSALQSVLFEQLLAAAWNLRRVRRLEAELFDGVKDPMVSEELEPKLERLDRYRARFERTLHRTMKELRACQTDAAVHAAVALETGENLPGFTQIGQMIKQARMFVGCGVLPKPAPWPECETNPTPPPPGPAPLSPEAAKRRL
jgi:hypothetical protein